MFREIIINVQIDSSPEEIHVLRFKQPPHPSEVINVLVQHNLIPENQKQFYSVLDYPSYMEIENNSNILVFRDPIGQHEKLRLSNYISPLISWAVMFIPYFLYKFGFSREIVAAAILLLPILWIVQKDTFPNILIPCNEDEDISPIDKLLFLYCIAFSPTCGEDDQMRITDSEDSDG